MCLRVNTVIVQLDAMPPSSEITVKRPEGGQNFRVILSALKYWNGVVDQIEDPLDRAEGRRFLLRTLATSAENYIDSWNPDSPHFHSTVDVNRKVYADSPDTDYLRSVLLLKNNRRYRIWGTIPPTTLYFGIQLYRSKGLPGNHIPDTAIPRDSEGNFEVIVTAEDPASLPANLRNKTILRGHGDEVSVIVRQYFADRTKEVPIKVHIELIVERGKVAHAEFNDTFFNIGAQRALANLDATLTNTLQAHETLSKLCYREFVRADGSRLFPTLDNRYLIAFFDGMRVKPGTPESDVPVILVRGCGSPLSSLLVSHAPR